MATLDHDPSAIDAGPRHKPATPGKVRVEHAATKQAAESEEHPADEFQQRRLAGFVRAVQHLDARPQRLDDDVSERTETIDLNPFDDHPAVSTVSGRFEQFERQPAGLAGQRGLLRLLHGEHEFGDAGGERRRAARLHRRCVAEQCRRRFDPVGLDLLAPGEKQTGIAEFANPGHRLGGDLGDMHPPRDAPPQSTAQRTIWSGPWESTDIPSRAVQIVVASSSSPPASDVIESVFQAT